ncbi:MAG: hypothetical protein IJD59_00875 [Clostridia bacterium]|nr:hypothetical protein [Clostridia bacterium]
MTDICSYHTFILPVVMSGTGKAIHSFDQITKCFDRNFYWKRSDPKDKNSFPDEENFRSYYKEYQYFYPQVRNAIYGNDGSIVRSYSFAAENVHEKAHYYITKRNRTYDLLINAIRLKVYNTGVALFIMECENHGRDKFGNKQDSFADIKNINDYGRRITLPFIPEKPEFSICADKLEISIPELSISFGSDFRSFIENVNQSNTPKELINLNHLCDFVKSIINYGGDYCFSTNGEKDAPKNAFRLRLALDDRMFVACIAINGDEAKAMLATDQNKSFDEERRYAYETDEKLSKSLYEFIFVDPAGDCTCQSGTMRKSLLEEHVYKRWFDYGSIYGLAAQSIVFLFDGSVDHLIESFLTVYEKIACLCIVQRASIVEFQKELANLSIQIHDKGNRMRTSTITLLMDLQERFAAFESQICFTEISCQEQAIEIYEAMTKFFFIDDEMANIKSQLAVLNEAANTYLDFGFNKVGYIFTILGGIFGVLGLSWLGTDNAVMMGPHDKMILINSFGFGALVWISVFWHYRRRRN